MQNVENAGSAGIGNTADCGIEWSRKKSSGRLLKIFLMVKFIAILIFAACLQVTARTYSQSVTLSEKDATLEKLFFEIKKQTGYTFFYQEDLLQNAKKVNLSVK